MIEIPKIVFTKTLTRSNWINTEIAKGDLKDEINKLKSKMGRTYSFMEVARSILP